MVIFKKNIPLIPQKTYRSKSFCHSYPKNDTARHFLELKMFGVMKYSILLQHRINKTIMIVSSTFQSIFRRAVSHADILLCCSGGMIFSMANLLYSFRNEGHVAFRLSAGAHSMTILCTIQKLVWIGKNDFE